MQIRKATEDDFNEVMRLYRQLQPDDPVLADGRDWEVFHRILETDGLYIFVLACGGRIYSTCYLNVIPNITRSARPYAIIENVVTDEAGAGLRVRQTPDEAHSRIRLVEGLLQGHDPGWIKAGSRRESTHAFYRLCGFSANDKVGYVARPGEKNDWGAWPARLQGEARQLIDICDWMIDQGFDAAEAAGVTIKLE